MPERNEMTMTRYCFFICIELKSSKIKCGRKAKTKGEDIRGVLLMSVGRFYKLQIDINI